MAAALWFSFIWSQTRWYVNDTRPFRGKNRAVNDVRNS
jgi:hypothetical protein